MDSRIKNLLEFTRGNTTNELISSYAPSDPGVHDYIRVLTKIRETGVVPLEPNFDLTEPIGLTGWGDPDDYERPQEFIDFRRFTSSIGLYLVVTGLNSDLVRPLHYLACDLIACLCKSSHHYISVLIPAFTAARENLLAWDEDGDAHPQASYVTVAIIYLAQFIDDWPTSERFSSLLIQEDFEMDNCHYDQLDAEWRTTFSSLRNPTNHGDTEFVIQFLRDDTAGTQS